MEQNNQAILQFRKYFSNPKLPLAVAPAAFIIAVAGIFLLQVVLKPFSPTPQPQASDTEDLTMSEVEGVYPESIEGWQTYRNEQFGFELKYPEKANIKTKPGPTWVNVSVENSEYSLIFFAGMREVGGPYGYTKLAWEKVLSVDGAEIILAANDYEEVDTIDPVSEIFLSSSRTCYVANERYDYFSSFISLNKLLTNEEEIVQIVESLRYFGDDCRRFDTSDWQAPLETPFLMGQTYRSEEFGFEVRYPEDVFTVVPVEGKLDTTVLKERDRN